MVVFSNCFFSVVRLVWMVVVVLGVRCFRLLVRILVMCFRLVGLS